MHDTAEYCLTDSEPCASNRDMETNYYADKDVRMNGKCRHCKGKHSAMVRVTWTKAFNGDCVLTHPQRGILRNTCINSYDSAWMTCDCGKSVLMRTVRGKYAADIKCDGRCMSATGFNCECSCGGKNHGAGNAIA